MAKATRFAVGSSGSSKHTETKGDGSSLGGRGPAESGPRIGPGAFAKRVKPEYDRAAGGNGSPAVKGMKTYSAG